MISPWNVLLKLLYSTYTPYPGGIGWPNCVMSLFFSTKIFYFLKLVGSIYWIRLNFHIHEKRLAPSKLNNNSTKGCTFSTVRLDSEISNELCLFSCENISLIIATYSKIGVSFHFIGEVYMFRKESLIAHSYLS